MALCCKQDDVTLVSVSVRGYSNTSSNMLTSRELTPKNNFCLYRLGLKTPHLRSRWNHPGARDADYEKGEPLDASRIDIETLLCYYSVVKMATCEARWLSAEQDDEMRRNMATCEAKW